MRSVLLLALLGALTACGSDPPPWFAGQPTPAPPTASTPTTGLRPTTTTRPPTTTRLPTTTPRTVSPDAAADGTDYSACGDGRCEVFVSGEVVIPLDPEFGFTTFQVTRTPTSTTILAVDPVNGTLRVGIGGTGQLKANDITVEVVAADRNGAVLRFTPRT